MYVNAGCQHHTARCSIACTMHRCRLQYGQTLVTGFGSLYGMPVGIVANNGGRLQPAHGCVCVLRRAVHTRLSASHS